jgi:hypothetical protein
VAGKDVRRSAHLLGRGVSVFDLDLRFAKALYAVMRIGECALLLPLAFVV